MARPPSKLYEFQKTVKRHKVGFITAGSVMIALLIGLALATLALMREREARERAMAAENQARQEAEKAMVLNEAVSDLLTSTDPASLKGADYTVRELLDDTSAEIASRYQDYPELELAMRQTVGKAYTGIGLGEKAVPHFERAIELRRRLHGDDGDETAQLLYETAWAWHNNKTIPQAENWQHAAPQLHKAQEYFRQQGESHRKQLALALQLEMMFMHRVQRISEVQQFGEEILAIAEVTPDLPPNIVADCLHNLALLRLKHRRSREAELFLRRSLETRRRVLPENDPENAWTLRNLGAALLDQGRLTEAKTAYEKALDLFTYHWSPWRDTDTLDGLSEILELQEDWQALEQILEYRLNAAREAAAKLDPEGDGASLGLARTLLRFGTAAEAQGQTQEAEVFGQEAIRIASNLVATSRAEVNDFNWFAWPLAIKVDPHPAEVNCAILLAEKAVAATGRTNGNLLDTLAAVYATAGDFGLAISIQQEAISLIPPEREDWLADFSSRLRLYKSGIRYCELWLYAKQLADVDRMEEAEALLLEQLDIMDKTPEAGVPEFASALSQLALLLVEHGQAEEAESFARECLALHEQHTPDSWLVFNARSVLGASLLGQNELSGAEPLLLSGYEGMAARESEIPKRLRYAAMEAAMLRLTGLYDALGDSSQAANWRQQIAKIDLVTY